MLKAALTFCSLLALALTAHGQVVLSSFSYSENFDSMGSAGTATPIGWFVGTGANAAVSTGTAVTAGTGSSTSGGNYNFGLAASGDRALGSLASAGPTRNTDLAITNSTGFSITQFMISYDGEQWRSGGATQLANTLTLQISFTGLANSWTDLGAAFNFTTPINGATAGALDGNNAANRVAGIGGVYTPSMAIANGATFYLRWADPDDTGTDAGIAIDDFNFTVIPEPATYMLFGIGLLACAQRFRRAKNK